MLIPKFFNWSECSFDEYQHDCNEFGFNCESSPEFISFLLRNNAPLKFYAYKKKNKVAGSVCVDNGWLVNDSKNNKRSISSLPLPSTSIYVPFNKMQDSKIVMPFRSKCIHPLQNKLFLNTSYNVFSKRRAAFSKSPTSDFSKKTVSTRERELRKFLNDGGAFINVNQLDGEHIFDIYEDLFNARRNRDIRDRDLNLRFFKEFQPNFKGHVMFRDDEPVAIQLLISASSKAGMFVDFINIGYRMDAKAGALGTMIMWKNLTSLHQEATDSNRELHYSYGALSGDYKARWCHPASVGRVVI